MICTDAIAQIPHLVRYQAQAVDDEGAPLEGSQTLTFRLDAAATGGMPVWEETQASVAVTSGHFSVLLGSVTPLEVDWTEPLWLGTPWGAGNELSPRVPLTAFSELASVSEHGGTR